MGSATNSSSPFYVSDIQSDRVLIRCIDSNLQEPDKSWGALPSWRENGLWYLPLESKADLPSLLMRLRDKGLPFLDDLKGWPPAAIFEKLIKEGKASRDYTTITFTGGGNYQTKEVK
jgi:hypothetical protein